MRICAFCGAEMSANETVCPICGFETQTGGTGSDENDPFAAENTPKPDKKQKQKADRQEPAPRNDAVRVIIPLIAFAVCFISIFLASAAVIMHQREKDISVEQTANNAFNQTADNAGSQQASSPAPNVLYAVTRQGTELGASNISASRTFSAGNVVDADHDTCWCVNTDERGGAGGQIEFVLSEKTYVHGLRIINGNQFRPNDLLYKLNGQAATIRLKCFDEDGRELDSELFDVTFNDGDPDAWQTMYLSNTVFADRITLQIVSSHVGTLYETNVCITEVEFF